MACCKIKSEQGGERAGQPEVNFCNPCYSSICSFGCSAFVKKHYYLYKKIKKIKVRKTQKIYVRGVEKKSRSTVQLKTYSIKYFRGCFAFVYKSKSRATVKKPSPKRTNISPNWCTLYTVLKQFLNNFYTI